MQHPVLRDGSMGPEASRTRQPWPWRFREFPYCAFLTGVSALTSYGTAPFSLRGVGEPKTAEHESGTGGPR
eukprot:scaffold726_cov262-Pinguiococcus_pyrenoidosus.AAC.6